MNTVRVRHNAKRSKATREANAQAILANKDHHEPTWDKDTLEKKATEIVENANVRLIKKLYKTALIARKCDFYESEIYGGMNLKG
jgi:hypothetical protein